MKLNKMWKIQSILILGMLSLPAVALAAPEDLWQLLAVILGVINGFLVPLIFAIAFIVFIWGVFLYFIAGATDEDKRDKGKNLMIFGLIGFFVMASIWGIVNLLVNTFDLDVGANFNTPQAPSVPGSSGGGNNNFNVWPG